VSANQRYADAASQILLHQGDVAADAQRQSGAIWGQAIGQLGSIASQGVTQIAAEHKAAQITDIFKKYGTDYDKAITEISAIDPVKGQEYAERYAKLQKNVFDAKKDQFEYQTKRLAWINGQLATVTDQNSLDQAIVTLAHVDPASITTIDRVYKPENVTAWRRTLETEAQRLERERPKPPNLSGPNQTGRDPVTGAVQFVNPPAPPAPPALPQIGTPAYDVMMRQQELLGAQGGPSMQTPPYAPAGTSGSGGPPPMTTPPYAPANTSGSGGGGPAAPLSIDQVEGRAPTAPAPARAPAATASGLTPTQAAIKAFADSRDAARDPSVAADRVADNRRADAQLEISRGQLEVSRGQLAVARQRANKPGATASDRDGLVDAVIASPGLWDQLTPTEKGKIAPALNERGFGDLGKPLPPAAVTKISDSKSAVDSLRDLKQVLKDNEQYVGPIAGFQALNPYSDANKAQAKIDLVRQRVGKALEGGVLRKEDEEKYKKILATLRDTPTTAVSKIDGLIRSVENDIANYVNEQRLAGRRVATTVAGRPGAAPAPATTPPPAGRQRVKGPNGQTGTVPIGAPLPTGWVIQ
jgi:hypothetical protein